VEGELDATGSGSVTKIDGWTEQGFEGVGDAFRANFDAGTEVGAAFAAYHEGHKVVDLWGGVANRKTREAWAEDTLVLVYSTTKGVTAMCANRLAQQGRIDVSAPVATYWPEFAEAGKEEVTVADLLSHRAGLAWVDGPMTLDAMLRWDPVVEALARQAPSWPPGRAHGYHATTFGWLVGEVVRRVTGTSIGSYLRQEICGPLGADFSIGLPAAEEPRVARLVSFLESMGAESPGTGPMTGIGSSLSAAAGAGPEMAQMAEAAKTYLAPDGPLTKALLAPGGVFADPEVWHSPRVHAAEIPAANGICDARSLALLYGACVGEVTTPAGDPFRILSPEQVERATQQETEGPDRVLMGLDIQWGLGFMLNRGLIAAAGLGGPRAFGHYGMGGSAGWAEPDLHLGMGYVMNRMEIGTTGDTRSFRLMQSCIEAARQR
jgi:CubicO group peptidase (beta-lactamase class C family)